MADEDSRSIRAGKPGESEGERLDRNWQEILQELRVIQTGTQILTGFLLTVAFQARFADLDAFQIAVYLALVVIAALATALGLAPVGLHRVLFRQGAKSQIVAIANRALKSTLALVAIVLSGTVLLIFDVVVSRAAGLVAGGVTASLILVGWWLLPLLVRRARK